MAKLISYSKTYVDIEINLVNLPKWRFTASSHSLAIEQSPVVLHGRF